MNSKSYSCDFGPKGSVFLRGMHLEHRFPFRVLFWLLSYTPDWCWRLGATSMMLFQNMVRVSGAGFVTQAKADEVSNFWKSKQAAAAQNLWDSPCYVSYDIPVSFLSGQGHVISKSCVFFFVHWFGLQMPHLLFLLWQGVSECPESFGTNRGEHQLQCEICGSIDACRTGGQGQGIWLWAGVLGCWATSNLRVPLVRDRVWLDSSWTKMNFYVSDC